MLTEITNRSGEPLYASAADAQGGRNHPESVDDLNWNAWSICVGIRNPKGERTFPPRPGTQSAEPKRGQESGRSIVVMTAWETRQERRGPAQLKRRW